MQKFYRITPGKTTLVFLGIYHTDTGQYISVSKRGQLPPFLLKREAKAPFLRSQAPPFEEKRGEQNKKGGKDTDQKY
jgi:hypothetical protein